MLQGMQRVLKFVGNNVVSFLFSRSAHPQKIKNKKQKEKRALWLEQICELINSRK